MKTSWFHPIQILSVVLVAFVVATFGSFESPQKAGAQQPNKKKEEKRFTIEFNKAEWRDVLTWYAEQSGLTYVSKHAPPAGTFSHSTPKGKTYTLHEVTVIVNESLMKTDHVLVPRTQTVTMVRIVK